jgi:hypothetical protein
MGREVGEGNGNWRERTTKDPSLLLLTFYFSLLTYLKGLFSILTLVWKRKRRKGTEIREFADVE